MPRSSRRLSASKTCHVMIRGNERKELFLDDDDRAWFVGMLFRFVKPSNRGCPWGKSKCSTKVKMSQGTVP
jgi:hypothetical protein